MQKLLNWIRENKIASVLIAILLLFVLQTVTARYFINRIFDSPGKLDAPQIAQDAMIEKSTFSEEGRGSIGFPSPIQEPAPQPDAENRLIVQNSNISLVVNNVTETTNEISRYVRENGGYMINSSVLRPEGLSKGTISVRVPSENLDAALTYFESLAVKVVSRETRGRDVTDEYIDIEERIKTLENSKAKYEELLNNTNDPDTILQVTNNIINLEERIDDLVGRQQYLEQTSETSLIVVNLATTELELPYAPEDPWQPQVIFKLAVRSLVGLGRDAASLAIWAGVYSIVWVPALGIYLYIRRKK